LAGKAARNDVNTASPRSAVKGADVIPDRERFKRPVVLTPQQYASCIFVELDGADGSPPKQSPSENATTSAREKCQLIDRSLHR
jgi:hypothetical protein